MSNNEWTMHRGECPVFTFTITGLPSGGLAAGTLAFNAWYDRQDAAAAIAKTNASFTVTTNGDDVTPGVATLTLAHTDTHNFPAWTLLLDVDLTFTETANSRETRVLTGTLYVKP